MPVLIDVSREKKLESEELSTGVSLDVGQEDTIVLTKFVSTNPQKACWAPSGVWREQVTADVGGGRRSVRVGIRRPDGSLRSVTVDDGLIIDLEGRLSGLVGLLPGRPPMAEAEVQAFVDQTGGRMPPLYERWDFRVVQVRKTDGPAARKKLHRSDEQKRLNSQEEMFRAFTQMFQMGGAAALGTTPNAQAVLDAGMKEAEREGTLFSEDFLADAASAAEDEKIKTE